MPTRDENQVVNITPKVTAMIQARTSSSRLPGKVLQKVRGKILLDYLVERLVKCLNIDAIVITTSNEPEDDAIVRYCNERSLHCRRGPLNDVATRIREVVESLAFPAFVRISGDSPLLDPTLVDEAIEVFHEKGCGLLTNIFPRSFPKGQSVEVIRSEVFLQGCAEMINDHDREHITPVFYRNPERFGVKNLHIEGASRAEVCMCVDTPRDLARFESVLDKMSRDHTDYSLKELFYLYEAAQEGLRSVADTGA